MRFDNHFILKKTLILLSVIILSSSIICNFHSRVFGTETALLPEKENGITQSINNIDWWPQFQKDAVHSGYSTSTAPHTNNLTWKTKIESGGEYCPIVVDNRVFIHPMDGNVYALDMRNGSILWTTNIRTHQVIQSPNWGHRIVSSPAYANGQLFVGSDDGRLYRLNASNGKIVWDVRIGFGILGIYGSVTYHEGKIFVGNGDTWKWDGPPIFPGFFSAIDANSGKVLWRHLLRGGIGSAPAVHNGRVFVGAFDHRLYAFNENDGSVVWRYIMNDTAWCSPSIADGMVFIGDMDGFIYAINESNGNEVWKFDGGEWLCCSTPTVYDGRVYFGLYTGTGSTYPSGIFYCLDEFTGKELRSIQRGHICPPPVIADEMIFYGSHDNYIYACNVSDLSEIWKYKTGDVVQGEGAMVDGHLFIGSNDGYLYCFGE